MKKLSLLLLICLFLFNFVSSAPPFLSSDRTTEGMIIQPPTFDYVKLNSAFELHAHVVNMSTGYILTAATTSCRLDIYNSSGDYIFKEMLAYDDGDFEYEIPSSNFSTLGVYSYIFNCNDSRIGGMVSGDYEVNYNGLEPLTSRSIYLSFIGLVILMFLIYSFRSITTSTRVMFVIFSILSYFLSLILSFLLWKVAEDYLYSFYWLSTLFYIIFLITLIMMFPFIIFLIVYLFFNIFNERNMKELTSIGFSRNEAKTFSKR